jgi:hypothetical protein
MNCQIKLGYSHIADGHRVISIAKPGAFGGMASTVTLGSMTTAECAGEARGLNKKPLR